MALPSETKRISETIWELPTSYKEGMRVPARIVATENLIREMDAGVFDQVTNVAPFPVRGFGVQHQLPIFAAQRATAVITGAPLAGLFFVAAPSSG